MISFDLRKVDQQFVMAIIELIYAYAKENFSAGIHQHTIGNDVYRAAVIGESEDSKNVTTNEAVCQVLYNVLTLAISMHTDDSQPSLGTKMYKLFDCLDNFPQVCTNLICGNRGRILKIM
jgi:hypothetical protein